jgi:hypothetical protein
MHFLRIRISIGNKIYLSYNYGRTWQASNSISSNWWGVAISDDGATIFGASSSTSPGIYKSSQLQDVLTSNTWAGPQSGTGTIAWISMASDAIGMNLVAGTRNAGMLAHDS